MAMIVRDVWIRCLVIESDNITIVIDSINRFTIVLIYSKRAVQYTSDVCNSKAIIFVYYYACKGPPVQLENERD
jgi:hypothetical protein